MSYKFLRFYFSNPTTFKANTIYLDSQVKKSLSVLWIYDRQYKFNFRRPFNCWAAYPLNLFPRKNDADIRSDQFWTWMF